MGIRTSLPGRVSIELLPILDPRLYLLTEWCPSFNVLGGRGKGCLWGSILGGRPEGLVNGFVKQFHLSVRKNYKGDTL